MLFTLGHGQHILMDRGPGHAGATASFNQDASSAIPIGAVLDATRPPGPAAAAAATAVATSTFAYYFANAADLSTTPAALDALGDAMGESAGDPPPENSKIPPIATYLGQFIDHDVTANTDRENSLSVIDGNITPISRSDVESGMLNLRDGSLRLDSLYGDTQGQGPFANKLASLMRHPMFQGKMRVAFPSPTPGQNTPLPADGAGDLLRLGFLITRGDITSAELNALSPELRRAFTNPDGTPNVELAIIGDARNDENLLVAQLHMSFLRFHNRVVDAVRDFEKARQLVRWHYQWLILNWYLPKVCDPDVLAKVVSNAAPVYKKFFSEHGTPGSARMPMPLEFSVAAFRFGHSMIRGAYDHNRFFGTAVDENTNLSEASFDLLFAFTGGGKMDGRAKKLPANWVIEWERFLAIDAAHPTRAARKIDTHLSPPLGILKNEPDGIFKHLAKRNLRRGFRLSLPTAQAVLAELRASHYPGLAGLDITQLKSGATSDAVIAGGFDTASPLWFYILKEAEVLAGGQHLGPLGSVLVAETLVGLTINDPSSYWNKSVGGQRWTPADANLGGSPIVGMSELLKFAGML